MANPRLIIDGPNNRAAIMINDDPGSAAANLSDPAFVNPLANFGSWKWAGHPDVDYLGIVSATTLTLNFDPNSGGWVGVDYTETAGKKYYYSYRKTVLTHNLGYTPVLVAYISGSGYAVPFQGDFPIKLNIEHNGGHGTIIGNANVYVDSSKVTIFVEGSSYQSTTNYQITLYLCNVGVDSSGNIVRPPLANGFEADVSTGRLRSGRFDTNYGYFCKDTSGSLMVYRGRSWDYAVGRQPSNSAFHYIGAAFNVNGYTQFDGSTLSTTDSGTGKSWPGNDKSAASIVKFSAVMPAPAQVLDASSGRIRFGNVLDTNRNMLLVANTVINKTTTIPAKSWSQHAYTDDTLVYDIANVHPNATDVLGLTTVGGKTYSIGGTTVPFKAIFGMMDYRFQENPGQSKRRGGIIFYYYRIASSKLQMVVRRIGAVAVLNRSFPSVTVKTTAFVGAFDY